MNSIQKEHNSINFRTGSKFTSMIRDRELWIKEQILELERTKLYFKDELQEEEKMNEPYDHDGPEITEIIACACYCTMPIDEAIEYLLSLKKQAEDNNYYNVEFGDNGSQWESEPVIIATRKRTTPSYIFK